MDKTVKTYSAALEEISEAVRSKINLQDILDLIVEKTATILGIKGSSLFVLEEGGKELKSMASYGLSRRYLEKGPILTDRSICETLEGKTVLIKTADSDPRIQYPDAAVQEGIAWILSLPLSLRGKAIGAQRVYAAEGYMSSSEAIAFARSLCDECALAIHNACRYETAEDRHEIMMADIWKWFSIQPDFRTRDSSISQPPSAATWQMHF